jgi:hypothetical protein
MSIESIAHLSAYMAKSEVMQEINMRLASMQLDQAEFAGDQLTAVMQTIDFTPGNVDISM